MIYWGSAVVLSHRVETQTTAQGLMGWDSYWEAVLQKLQLDKKTKHFPSSFLSFCNSLSHLSRCVSFDSLPTVGFLIRVMWESGVWGLYLWGWSPPFCTSPSLHSLCEWLGSLSAALNGIHHAMCRVSCSQRATPFATSQSIFICLFSSFLVGETDFSSEKL